MQYTTENTEGYSAYDLAALNRIYEHRIALLDESERENADLLQHISEQVLADYALARDEVPDQIPGADLIPARVIIRDLQIRGSADDRATVALVDLEYPQTGDSLQGIILVVYRARSGSSYWKTGDSLQGIILVVYPYEGAECGALITQRDWQSPVDVIPLDLNEIQWPNNVIVCGDGLPRYLSGPW